MKYLVVVLSFLLTSYTFQLGIVGEEYSFYQSIVNSQEKIVILETKQGDTRDTLRHLGKLFIGSNEYNVITSFKVIGLKTMLSPRGQSNLVFVSSTKESIMTYNFNMPNELPISVENNTLIFNYNSEKIEVEVDQLLPLFCVPKIGCSN